MGWVGCDDGAERAGTTEVVAKARKAGCGVQPGLRAERQELAQVEEEYRLDRIRNLADRRLERGSARQRAARRSSPAGAVETITWSPETA